MQQCKAHASRIKAHEQRQIGNRLMKQQEYGLALKVYTDALELDQGNEQLWANRSICFLKLDQPHCAFGDAIQCRKVVFLFFFIFLYYFLLISIWFH